MDQQKANKIKIKNKFNELVSKLTQYKLTNRDPPDELSKEARNLALEMDVQVVELIKIF